mmetsp:Transcript_54287/g.101802  ORF Transcript_54287/g.101802 Transcript_54287/m.101802 type:complete len:114 (-) Transcript_54287:50-391(-)
MSGRASFRHFRRQPGKLLPKACCLQLVDAPIQRWTSCSRSWMPYLSQKVAPGVGATDRGTVGARDAIENQVSRSSASSWYLRTRVESRLSSASSTRSKNVQKRGDVAQAEKFW